MKRKRGKFFFVLDRKLLGFKKRISKFEFLHIHYNTFHTHRFRVRGYLVAFD